MTSLSPDAVAFNPLANKHVVRERSLPEILSELTAHSRGSDLLKLALEPERRMLSRTWELLDVQCEVLYVERRQMEEENRRLVQAKTATDRMMATTLRELKLCQEKCKRLTLEAEKVRRQNLQNYYRQLLTQQ